MEIKTAKPIKLPTNFGSSKRSSIEVVLLIVIMVLFSWFILFPKKNALQTQTDYLAGLQTEANRLTQNLENLKSLVNNVSVHEQQFQKLDQALPLESRDGKPIRVRLLLESLAKSSGVTISSINVTGKNGVVVAGDKSLNADPFAVQRQEQTLAVGLDVVGTFDQTQTFLHNIETNARVMNLSDLEFNIFQNNLIEMRVSLETYYYGPTSP